jgi:hypothetical protein
MEQVKNKNKVQPKPDTDIYRTPILNVFSHQNPCFAKNEQTFRECFPVQQLDQIAMSPTKVLRCRQMNITQFIGLPFKDGLDTPQFIVDLFKWLTDTDLLPILSKITNAN